MGGDQMICGFCGNESSDSFVTKIQKRIDTVGRDKANIAEIDTCAICAAELLEKHHNHKKRVMQKGEALLEEANETNIEDIHIMGVDYSNGKEITVVTIRLDSLLPWQREQILNQMWGGSLAWPVEPKQPIS